MVRNSPDSKGRGTRSPLFEGRNCILAVPKGKNSCPPTPWEMCRVPPASKGSLPRSAASHLGLPHPGLLPVPLAARKHHPATARALPGQRNSTTESHSRSSKHKDKSLRDKSSKHSSDKEATKSPRKRRMSPPS